MVFRLDPKLPVGAYRTFSVRSPLSTHTRVASCQEVDCQALECGWTTTVDETTLLGQQQAHYIRKQSGRHYTEARTSAGLTAFTFPAGQRCFQEHRVSLDRPEIFTARPGDWRIRPTRHDIYVHKRADDWLDEFAANQDKLSTLIARG